MDAECLLECTQLGDLGRGTMVDSSDVVSLSGSCRLAARRSRAFGLEESVL